MSPTNTLIEETPSTSYSSTSSTPTSSSMGDSSTSSTSSSSPTRSAVRRPISMGRLAHVLLTTYLLLTVFRESPPSTTTIGAVTPTTGVRCFCDKRNCETALMCTGAACLVGFKSDVRLDQMCATAESNEIAECTENWASWKEVCKCTQDFCNTFNYLRTQMERMRHDGRYPHEVADPDRRQMQTPPVYQSNQLIILLVIVPLGIGAAAVILVFLNYHCKMC